MEQILVELGKLIPEALAAGAITQAVKETGWVRTKWMLTVVAIGTGGVMGFLATGGVVSGMAAGGLAPSIFALAKRKLESKQGA